MTGDDAGAGSRKDSISPGEGFVGSEEGAAAPDGPAPVDEEAPTLEEAIGTDLDLSLGETPEPDATGVTPQDADELEAVGAVAETSASGDAAGGETAETAAGAPGEDVSADEVSANGAHGDGEPARDAPGDSPPPPATGRAPALIAVGPSGAEPVSARGVAPTLRALRRPSAPITWLHAESFEDLLPALEDFGLHELAVRSLRDGPERPRVEEFPDHLYVSLLRAGTSAPDGEGAGRASSDGSSVHIEELRIFLGDRWIFSFGPIAPEEHAALTEVVVRQVMDRGRGPSFVLYYLAEWVVETLYPLLDSLDDRVDSLEDLVLLDTGAETRQELFRLKRDLVEFRRRVAPTRDVMQRLSGHGLSFVEPEADVFFRDVHDDVLLVLEQLDTYRDILSSALDLHLSTVSNRLNEVMKRLTLVATLFMPITFITGFFGMNFSGLPIASMAWYWGTVAAMAAIAVGMAGYAWRRGWF